MKKQTLFLLIAMLANAVFFSSPLFAEDCCPHGQNQQFQQISDVNGYQLRYQFIDMKEKMKGMEHPMEGMTATHHLMVYITNAQGESVTAEKVGYLITGPDGKEQKVMTMGMSGGYGSDIDLSLPGEYTIKTKAIMVDQTPMDSFSYQASQPHSAN